jgi:hypothetical protein
MKEQVTSCGSGYQVKLPNGNTVKSENRRALEDLLVNAERKAAREARITEAWNKAVDVAGVRYRLMVEGRKLTQDRTQQAQLNLRQVDFAVGRVEKSEAAFLAALVLFQDQTKGTILMRRIGCTDIRSLAESLESQHARAIAQLMIAYQNG